MAAAARPSPASRRASSRRALSDGLGVDRLRVRGRRRVRIGDRGLRVLACGDGLIELVLVVRVRLGVRVAVVERHRVRAVTGEPVRLADVEQQQRLLRDQIGLLHASIAACTRRPGSAADLRRRAAWPSHCHPRARACSRVAHTSPTSSYAWSEQSRYARCNVSLRVGGRVCWVCIMDGLLQAKLSRLRDHMR